MFGVLSQLPVVVNLDFIPPNICSERWPSKSLNITYTLLLSLIQFFIPVVFLGMIYWKICGELIKQREKIKSKSEDTERWLFQRLVHHRSARTFAITFVIFVYFVVAGSPQQIGIILHTFGVVDLNTYYDWFNVMYYFGVSAVIIL
jgi:hypothetical protein